MDHFQKTYLILTSLIYNVAIVTLIYKAGYAIDLKTTLREKNGRPPDGAAIGAVAAGAAQGAAVGAQVGGAPADAALNAAAGAAGGALAAAQGDAADPSQGGNSYSRITGLVGAAILSCFIWAIGNVVLFNAFSNPDAVEKILSGVGTFILSGSALFAPYAFNQLSKVFQK